MLKKSIDIIIPKSNFCFVFLNKIGSNFIDIIDYFKVKNKGNINFLEITFKKVYTDKIISKTIIYSKKNNFITKYKVIFSIPNSILSIDFNNNKRYFYNNAPKYLDISKILPLLDKEANTAILKIDTFPYLQGDFYLNQSNYNFFKHSLILGSSGSGKSKFISLFINNIYKNFNLQQKYKIIVIDPHSALEDEVGGLAKVIDFNTKKDSIDLFINNSEDVISSTELLLELLKSLILEQYNPKLERVLRHSIYLLLTNKTFNFNNLRNLLLSSEYRNLLIKKLKYNLPVSIIEFFLSDFNELKTKFYGETISPIIAFIDEMEILPVFSAENNCQNFQDIISNNFLTLFSLDRTKLGNKIVKTISGLIMQQLLLLIQSHKIQEHVIFIVDEVAVIENSIMPKFLSEARKYNLSFILAGQYFNQLSQELKNSIFANVVNYYIFRVSKIDANTLVDNVDMKVPLDNSKEQKIKILTELNNRECITRINNNEILLPAFKAKTLNYNNIPRIKNTVKSKINNKNIKHQNKEIKFQIGNDINLKDILIENSTSRKVLK